MAIDKTIFGLRFGANDELFPLQEDLRSFLNSPKEENGRALHRDDLTAYTEMLESIRALGIYRARGTASENLRAKMFYSALEHVSFFNQAFRSAVEQYKYHLHELRAIDFKKPAAFIKSAEEELGKLNPKRKDEAARLARLRKMVDERRSALDARQKRWASLAKELNHIARYVRDNLVKIEMLCSSSINMLRAPQLVLNEKRLIIDEIKVYFREFLKDSLHRGLVTKQDLDNAKKDVETLSQEISELVEDDLGSLAGLYESIFGHVGKAVRTIDELTASIEEHQDQSVDNCRGLFTQLEGAFVSVMSGYHFEFRIKETRSATKCGDILDDKRKEMLDRILEQLQKERRSWDDRRYLADRRRFRDPTYKGPLQRSGKDRRAKKRRIGR